jgi:hypothetical protein
MAAVIVAPLAVLAATVAIIAGVWVVLENFGLV